jgi:hypothetical protein
MTPQPEPRETPLQKIVRLKEQIHNFKGPLPRLIVYMQRLNAWIEQAEHA